MRATGGIPAADDTPALGNRRLTMRISIFAVALLGAACSQAPASIPDPAAPPAEADEHSRARSVYGAASLGGDSAAKQQLGRQAAPNSDVLPPPPSGQRSPDESPTNKYHVTRIQVDLFQNPDNLKMTVARQFVWDQYKLAWWAQHHQQNGEYIKKHKLLFNKVKVRSDEGFRMRPHITGTRVMQMRAVACEFPILEVRDENGIVINNGL